MEFQRVTPESIGISSEAVLDLLDELYRYGIEMHSIMLLRHGKVCAEGWWRPYTPQSPHIMFSFSKSLTSTAIGFAVQEGLLSLNDRLIEIFPDKLPENPSENLKKATVRHLLMMGCGHETEIPWGVDGNPEWISDFLHHPFVHEPGTYFMYNTAGTNMLCAILKRKTGQGLTEFLKPRLFQPLGMSDIHCHTLPDGTEMGGAGCSLTTEDMARFIQFVANKGKWEGRQLLNEAWFDQATQKQIDNYEDNAAGSSDWRQGYCFQYWCCQPEGVFRGDGAFGQYGIVFPRQDAVFIATSASTQMQAALNAVWDKFLPALHDGPLPENPEAQLLLANRLKHLELCPMLGMRNPGAEDSLNGATYIPDGPTPSMTDWIGGAGKFGTDGGSLTSLTFLFAGTDDVRLRCTQDNGEYELKIGMTGHYALTDLNGVIYGANGRWRAADKLEIEMRNTRLVAGKRFLFRFSGTKMTVSADSTIAGSDGLNDPSTPDYTFTLKEGDVNLKTKMYWEK